MNTFVANRAKRAARWLIMIAAAFMPSWTVSAAEPFEVERQAIEARRKIERGHFAYHLTYSTSQPMRTPAKRDVEIWLDGTTTRMDLTADNIRQTSCRKCQNFEFLWFEEPDPSGGRRAISVDERSRGSNLDYIVDPRFVGMASGGFQNLPLMLIDQVVGFKNRREPARREVKWKGQEAVEITYIYDESGGVARFVLVPEWSQSLVFMNLQWTAGNRQLEDELNIEVKKSEPSGVWYPSKIVETRKRDGVLEYTETVVVKKAEINAPIDPKTFLLAGMAVPVGKKIYMRDNSRPIRKWDGEKIIIESPERKSKNNSVQLRSDWTPILALGLACSAGGGIWLATRRSKSAP